jgi:hypothetical protein
MKELRKEEGYPQDSSLSAMRKRMLTIIIK